MQTITIDVGVTDNSGVFGSLESGHRLSVQVTWPASAAGVFSLQRTNEEQVNLPTGTAPSWTTVGQIAVADGANAGSSTVDFDAVASRFRVHFERTAGTAGQKAYVSPITAKSR